MSASNYREGYYTGILDVYYAVMDDEDTTAAAPEYDEPKILGRSIEVSVTPNYVEGSVYASNVATRQEKRVGSYTVSVNADAILTADLAAVLGRVTDNSGVQLIKPTASAPYVALGFALTLDDGSKEYWWLYKGKFSEPTTTGHTLEDSITYQHPTIEGTFVRRANDDVIAVILDDTTADTSTIAEGWFDEVYETPTQNNG